MNSRSPKSRPKSLRAGKRSSAQKRSIAPGISAFFDSPPQNSTLTDYDRRHLTLYVRLLDAAEEGAHWTEVVRVLFGLDPDQEGERARSIHDSHLARARWMAEHGYRELLITTLQ